MTVAKIEVFIGLQHCYLVGVQPEGINLCWGDKNFLSEKVY